MLSIQKRPKKRKMENVGLNELRELIPKTVFTTLLVTAFIFVVCPFFCLHPLFQGLLSSKHASVTLLATYIGSLTLLFITPIVLLVGAIEFKLNRLTKRNAIYVIIFTTYLTFHMPLSNLNYKVRVKSYVSSMLQLQPLVNSIKEYTKRTGSHPEHLCEILNICPYENFYTGINAFPTVDYSDHRHIGKDEKTWSLRIDTYYDLPFYAVIYNPSKNNEGTVVAGIDVPPNWIIKTVNSL